MNTTIPKKKKDEIFGKLKTANTAFQKVYPGDRPERQPVHTLYGGANLFKYDAAAALGQRALDIFNLYAPDFVVFGKVFGLEGADRLPKNTSAAALKKAYEKLSPVKKKQHPAYLSYEVYHKVVRKLEKEAIEDFRIDFEDGFGNRSNEE